MGKIKLATTWLDCCSGCHMSFLDIDETIIKLAESVEFNASPITDIKEFSQVDVGFVEGSVGNDHDVAVVQDLRSKCRILIAVGDCACFGGINSMRNLFDTQELLKRVYGTQSTLQKGIIPTQELPKLLWQRPVNQIVKVDCYIPGCPPSAKNILYVLQEILQGRIPVLPGEMMRFD
jgi:NAD-reducing hydrogenase small subunit